MHNLLEKTLFASNEHLDTEALAERALNLLNSYEKKFDSAAHISSHRTKLRDAAKEVVAKLTTYMEVNQRPNIALAKEFIETHLLSPLKQAVAEVEKSW